MTKRKVEPSIEPISKQKKIVNEENDEELDATLGEITEITDMPTMGQGNRFKNTNFFMYLIFRKMEK